MWSGNPLTQQMCEALFVNALDMWQEGNHQQFLKAPQYDGVIKSELEPIEYLGEPAIPFEAMVASKEWEGTQVKFVVHVDALEKAEEGMWEAMKMAVSEAPNAPPPPPSRPRSQYDVPFSMN